MLTTDTVHKLAGRTVTIGGREIQITGMAKGAAMMGPNMATMLALIMTDAALDPAVAQAALRAATDDSFNCMSVDGHMSTNDTVLLVANGAAGGAAAGRRRSGRFPPHAGRSVRRSGQGHRRRRRRGHAPGHHRDQRLRRPAPRPWPSPRPWPTARW